MSRQTNVLVVAEGDTRAVTDPFESDPETTVAGVVDPGSVSEAGGDDHGEVDCVVVVADACVDVPGVVDSLDRSAPIVVADTDDRGAVAALASGADEVVTAGTPSPVLVHRVKAVAEGREAATGSDDRYLSLVETVGDAMYVLDQAGYIEYVNDAHVELSGYDRERLVGNHVTEFMSEEDVQAGTEVVTDLLSNPDEQWGRYEFEAERPDGERRVYEDNIAVRTDEDGEFQGTVGVIRDITDRKRAERQVAEQNRRLEQFSSLVSHDLRSPLNVAQGHLETGLADGDLQRHAREAVESLDRMEGLIENLLELAREGEAVIDPEPVDLDSLAEAAWSSVDGGDATLTVPETTTVRGDRSRLRRLFENLFRNAVEHAGEDVTVTVAVTDDGFAVEDDGPGIPEAERDAMLEWGVTTEEGGTGLGLAIVERVASAHGWTVTVGESETGGARFAFTTG